MRQNSAPDLVGIFGWNQEFGSFFMIMFNVQVDDVVFYQCAIDAPTLATPHHQLFHLFVCLRRPFSFDDITDDASHRNTIVARFPRN
jgi:hypothetical protein